MDLVLLIYKDSTWFFNFVLVVWFCGQEGMMIYFRLKTTSDIVKVSWFASLILSATLIVFALLHNIFAYSRGYELDIFREP